MVDRATSPAGVDVSGLATAVSIKHADATDSLPLNTFGGKLSLFVNSVDGRLQLLIDGSPAS
jgi:hypothetical protein